MQKKTRNSRGKTRAMETHFYTMECFFVLLDFPYEHSERFLTFFVSISTMMNAKNNSKFEREPL